MRGSSSRSGPAPDPNALRRDRDAGEWLVLPAEGRSGPAPEFPLKNLMGREAELWAELWVKPQAVAWERAGLLLEVALFTRRFVEVEQHNAAAIKGTLVRQMMDSLGLTTPGLRSNRWRIEAVEQPKAQQTAPRASSRSRLTVVAEGAS